MGERFLKLVPNGSGATVSAVKEGIEVMGRVDTGTTMRYVHAADEGKRRVAEAAATRRGKEEPATNPPPALDKTA